MDCSTPRIWRHHPNVNKICLNILLLCKQPQRTRDLKLKFLFAVWTASLHESFEGLNSSLGFSNGKLWPYPKGVLFNPWFPFVGVEILTTFWFWWHNFWSRYAIRSIKVSKDSYDSLVSKKNLSETIGSLDWRPGLGELGLN